MACQFLVLRVDQCDSISDSSPTCRLLFQGVNANTWFSTRGITQSTSHLPTGAATSATPRINPQIVRALQIRSRDQHQSGQMDGTAVVHGRALFHLPTHEIQSSSTTSTSSSSTTSFTRVNSSSRSASKSLRRTEQSFHEVIMPFHKAMSVNPQPKDVKSKAEFCETPSLHRSFELHQRRQSSRQHPLRGRPSSDLLPECLQNTTQQQIECCQTKCETAPKMASKTCSGGLVRQNHRPPLLPLVYDKSLAESRFEAGLRAAGQRSTFRACLSASADFCNDINDYERAPRRQITCASRNRMLTANSSKRRQILHLPWHEDVCQAMLAPISLSRTSE